MSLERMFMNSVSGAVGADAARIFTRKKNNASLFFIGMLCLALSIYGWLLLLRKKSAWWQRVLAIPMVILGTSFFLLIGGPKSDTMVAYIFFAPLIVGGIACLVSNSNYSEEIKQKEMELELNALNAAFFEENELTPLENGDLFSNEHGVHFKKISTMADGILFSIVGKRGKRAKLTADGLQFTSFEILE